MQARNTIHLLKHMKSLFFKPICLIIFFSVLIVSCAKDNPEPEDNPATPNTPVNNGKFTYSVNGNATITADSAIYYPKFTTIYSYKVGLQNTIEINLSDITVGSYTVSSVMGNALTYDTNGQTFTAKSGVVNITSNTGSRLSGDFNCSFSSGISTISGQFNDIRYR